MVVIGSDSMHLTQHQGDKHCHAVYMTIGNIHQDFRLKASSRCWMMVGQIPKPKFLEKKFQGMLQARLFHMCFDVIFRRLKQCSKNPQMMVDPSGELRRTRTLLPAHIADLPEQRDVAVVSTSQSPSSMANTKTFGLNRAQKVRTGKMTLARIRKVVAKVDPNDLKKFERAAKKEGLNGVVEPFWRDWKFADPSVFLVPDALHQWHKLFMDHILKWGRDLLTDDEMDKRISCLQPVVGYRHFRNGFTRFQQHTGREQRDIQRVFIAVLQDHPSITNGVMRAFRAFLDFVYIAQYPCQTEATMKELDDALKRFHANKIHLSSSGVRDGPNKKGEFHVPKLELLWHVLRLLRLCGTPPQWTSDQTERLHMAVKTAYQATNKKDFEVQMCRHADRDEKVVLFAHFLEWQTGVDDIELDDELRQPDHTAERLRKVRISRTDTGELMPVPVRDNFMRKGSERNDFASFTVNSSRIPRKSWIVDRIAELYRLPDLYAALGDFFSDHTVESRNGQRICKSDCALPFLKMHTWDKTRVQLKAVHNDAILMPTVTVTATPPSPGRGLPEGRYNFVLVPERLDAKVTGIKGIVLDISRAVIDAN